MTIPIQPGPFSFLTTLGQGVGNAFEARDKARQQKFVNNIQQIEKIQSLIKDGVLKSNVLAQPGFFNLLTSTLSGGAEAADAAPKVKEGLRARPEEMKDEGQANFFTRLQELGLAGNLSPELSALAYGTPTPGQVGEERLKTMVSNKKVEAVDAGGAVGRAVSGVPSEQVAQAQETAAVGPVIQDDADKYIAATIAQRGGRTPTTAEQSKAVLEQSYAAYALDKTQEGTAPMPLDEYRKKYFGTALLKYQIMQANLDTQRFRAMATQANTGDKIAADGLKIQLQVARDMLAKMESKEGRESYGITSLTPILAAQLATKKPTDPDYSKYVDAAQRMQLYQEALDLQRGLVSRYDAQISSAVTAPLTGQSIAPPVAPPSPGPSINIVDKGVTGLASGKITRDQLKADVEKDPSRIKPVNEIIRRYNANAKTKIREIQYDPKTKKVL